MDCFAALAITESATLAMTESVALAMTESAAGNRTALQGMNQDDQRLSWRQRQCGARADAKMAPAPQRLDAAAGARAVADREFRLRLPVHVLDALHLALQQHSFAELCVRRHQALLRTLVEQALGDRLRQPLLLQRHLRRPRACGRSRARDCDRPARAVRILLANHLSLSARRVVRRDR